MWIIGNNWAKGFYTSGQETFEKTRDAIRREIERMDTLEGIQILHSIAGGAGGGLGEKILTHLREEYYNTTISGLTLLPSLSGSLASSALEAYNTVLSFHHEIENTDMNFCFENDAVFGMCAHANSNLSNFEKNDFQNRNTSFSELNRMIAAGISGITCGYRFPCQVFLLIFLYNIKLCRVLC